MTRRIAFLIVCFGAVCAIALANQRQVPELVPVPDPIGNPLDCYCQVFVKRYHDADTITLCDIHLPYNIVIRDVSLRAADFDACECDRTRQTVEITEAELKRGKAAAKAFQELCESGSLYTSPPLGNCRDPHGRYLGKWRVVQGWKQIEVREWMADRKYLRGKQ